jgi:hypothetical protein
MSFIFANAVSKANIKGAKMSALINTEFNGFWKGQIRKHLGP